MISTRPRSSNTASCRSLQKKLEEEEKHTQEKEQRNSLLRDKVTDEEIARIVERWTGIPVTR